MRSPRDVRRAVAGPRVFHPERLEDLRREVAVVAHAARPFDDTIEKKERLVVVRLGLTARESEAVDLHEGESRITRGSWVPDAQAWAVDGHPRRVIQHSSQGGASAAHDEVREPLRDIVIETQLPRVAELEDSGCRKLLRYRANFEHRVRRHGNVPLD